VETKGSLNDFTGSEAILGPILEATHKMALYLRRKMVVLQIVNAAQGFAGLGVSAGLSGPACAG